MISLFGTAVWFLIRNEVTHKKNKLDIPNRLHLKIRRKYNKFR
jgi:hypothetical protein